MHVKHLKASIFYLTFKLIEKKKVSIWRRVCWRECLTFDRVLQKFKKGGLDKKGVEKK